MTVSVNTETIGPAEAKALLEKNPMNRHLRDVLVRQFRRDIEAGRWVLNGETIKISESGNLIDGQHRLKAVLDSGKSIDTLVVRGLPETVLETVDTGAHRTFGDTLRLRGEDHYYTLAAVCRMSWVMDVGGKPLSGAGNTPTFGDLTAYLEKRPELRKHAAMAVFGPRSVLRLPGSLVGALSYQMSLIDEELSTEFWRQLFENDAKKGSAVHVIREQLLKDTKMPHRMSTNYRAAVLIKAWNMWMEGREPAYIAWKPNEDYPRLRGPIREAVAV